MAALDYVGKANRYIRDVTSGKRSACLFVRQACERQLRDLERSEKNAKDFPFLFDRKAANRPCAFTEHLRHVKGPKAGEQIHLEDWQCFIITTLYGWKYRSGKWEGRRRFRKSYTEVPRGNGKSTLCSALALYMLCADGENGADIYSFATTRDQARIVFDDALAMARGNADLRAAYDLKTFNHSMAIIGTNSKFLPKSADADTLDGLNTHFAVIDELHAHKTRAVHDVVETSIGKRTQPLIFEITTAGFLLFGICMEDRRYVGHILDRSVYDENFFGIIYTIDQDDDWKSIAALKKANPNWGISCDETTILSNRKKALVTTSAQKNYLTKHLDVWVNSDSQWLDMEKFRKCVSPELREEDFRGCYCIYGLDLASKLDIAAVVKLFWRKNTQGAIEYYVFQEFYLPAEAAQNSENSDYSGWVADGYLRITDGAITNLAEIQDYIRDDAKQYETLAVAYDPMQATQMSQTLLAEGVEMVELPQTLKNMSEPMKQLQALIYEGRIHFDGSPVMSWMFANVVCHLDAKENVYPRKEKAGDKIDGVVALIMALNQAIQKDVENEYAEGRPREGGIDWSSFTL
ncbi:MAG: terminase large subunit [Oscillospiraceae bacterium]|nr:terminase large subunit [Oscillospiraceae bacterium]